jgi:restriction system protein
MTSIIEFSDTNTLWVIQIGNNDRIALRALEEGFVYIGWTEMGDLSVHRTRPAMRTAMEAAYPSWTAKKINSSYGQTYRFAHEMRVGEPVVFPVRPTKEIAIGRISGEYRWAADRSSHLHRSP